MRFIWVFLCCLSLLLISYPGFVYSESDIFLHKETGLRIAVVEQDKSPAISITWNGDVLQYSDQYHLFSPSRLVVEFISKNGESFPDVRYRGNDILTGVILDANSKRVSIEITLGVLLQKCTGFTPVITGNVLTSVCEVESISSETKNPEDLVTSLAARMGRRERQLNRLLNRIEREHSRRTESGEIIITVPFFLSGLIFFSWLLILILVQRRTIRKLKFATLRLPEKMRKSNKNTPQVFKTLELPEADAVPLQNLHSCYTLLGASSEWGDEELKNHYRLLIRKYHPDYLLNAGFSEDMIAAFADRYRDIQQAYETIMTTRAILRNQIYHRG